MIVEATGTLNVEGLQETPAAEGGRIRVGLRNAGTLSLGSAGAALLLTGSLYNGASLRLSGDLTAQGSF